MNRWQTFGPPRSAPRTGSDTRAASGQGSLRGIAYYNFGALVEKNPRPDVTELAIMLDAGTDRITLVGLAAGAGSRFGGPKQLEPLGPDGETMLDFAIHDALNAGFDAVVLIVREEMSDAFENGVVARWHERVPVSLAFQHVPDDRKPWGTVDAVFSAADRITGPFAVVNADDYYGAGAYRELHAFLRRASLAATEYAVVGFPLTETLAESGGVTRGLMRVAPHGWLESIEEIFEVERRGDLIVARDAAGVGGEIDDGALVSLNMWGFTPAIFPQLARGLVDFRYAHRADLSAELPLPTLVGQLVLKREARVRVLRGEGPWCGVTHPADRPPVWRFLGGLIERGDYPSPLWAARKHPTE